MKTKLIALVALSVASFSFLPEDVPEGAEFEVEPEHAEGLLTTSMARLAEPPLSTPQNQPPQKEKVVKVRVLVNCQHGNPDDVVELPAATAKAEERAGLVDADKGAVAYALSLPQNKRG